MTEKEDKEVPRVNEAPPSSKAGRDSLADNQLRELMKQTFDVDDDSHVDVLGGVQQRLRARSGGKFYADGWSTSRPSPFSTYFITSLMMIAIVVIIYAILVPLVGDPIELPREPNPVQPVPR